MPSIEVSELGLQGLREIRVPLREDLRGEFAEIWNPRDWLEAGVDLAIVQHNRSRSRRGVLRGLHYQLPPAAQSKVVRVTHGAVFDVAVDCRRSSATFGNWLGLTLTAFDNRQFLIPEGFAHGFLALEEDTVVEYLVTAPYSPAHERSLRFDDPDLAISWPILGCPFLLSDKDHQAPALAVAELFE